MCRCLCDSELNAHSARLILHHMRNLLYVYISNPICSHISAANQYGHSTLTRRQYLTYVLQIKFFDFFPHQVLFARSWAFCYLSHLCNSCCALCGMRWAKSIIYWIGNGQRNWSMKSLNFSFSADTLQSGDTGQYKFGTSFVKNLKNLPRFYTPRSFNEN